MRSSVAARLRDFSTLVLAILLACTLCAPAAWADIVPSENDSGEAVEVDSSDETDTTDEGDVSLPVEDADAMVPAAVSAANTRTYVLPAATLSSFSVATIVSGTVELAPVVPEGEGESVDASIPTISVTYVADGCVYVLDEGASEFALVNAANAELTDEGYILVPSALVLDGETHPVTSVAAGAMNDSNVVLVALSKNVVSVDNDAFAGAEDLQAVYVSPDNVTYSSYDGVLYDVDLTSLLLVPEGKLGTVRIPSGVETIRSEAFSHCAFVDAVFADADSAAFQTLESVTLCNENDQPIEVVAIEEGVEPSDTIADDEPTDEGVTFDILFESAVLEDSQADVEAGDASELVRTPIEYDIAPDAVDKLVHAIDAYPLVVESEVISIDERESNSILTREMSLVEDGAIAQTDNDIFHMELMPDGSGFMLKYIDPSASGAVTIPALWTQNGQTLPVVAIGSWALCEGYREGVHAFDVTSIHIPATLTSIGASYPFGWKAERQLVSITVDTGNAAYASKDGVLFTKDMESLIFYPVRKADTDYRIPSGVTSVYPAAFTRCYNLTSITIPSSLSAKLGNWTLLDACDNVADIMVMDSTNSAMTSAICIAMSTANITVHLADCTPNQISIWISAGFPADKIVELEPQFVFEKNSAGTGYVLKAASSLLVGEVDVPSTWTQDGETLPVVGIGPFAFCEGANQGKHALGVTSIHIPASVTSISSHYAFGWNGTMNLKSVTIDASNPSFCSVDGVVYDKSISTLIFYPFAKPDATYMMPSTLTNYQQAAMTRCRYLKSITFCSSVMGNLNHLLMDGCGALRDVYVDGETSASMDGNWFQFSSKDVVTVHLRDYTSSEIQLWTAAGFKVDSIVALGSVFTFAENSAHTGYVIMGVSSSAKGDLVVPSQWTQNGKTLPVVKIESWAFNSGAISNPDAANITSIQIPSSVTGIGSSYPFGWRDGRALAAVKVDASNSSFCSVDGVLFSKDKRTLVFYPPARVERNYSVPAGTRYIQGAAFTRCSYLRSIVFPASYAANLSNTCTFDSNSAMTDIYVEGATASTLGSSLVDFVDKTRYTIHLANYTPTEIQLWVNAGFLMKSIVPSNGTASYSIGFDVEGGTPRIAEQTVLRDGHVAKPANPTRTGYDFVGWYSFRRDKIWDFASDTVDVDMTLIAVWDPHVVTLRLNIGEHADLVDAGSGFQVKVDDTGRYVECPIAYDTTFTLPLLKRAGHKLIAWKDASGAVVPDMNGDALVNGGSVRNLSVDDGIQIVYEADWQPVYNIEVPLQVNLVVHADFIDGRIEVTPLSEHSATGLFSNYSEGPVEIVAISDETDGVAAKTVFPNGGHEKAFLTISPDSATGAVALGLGKSATVTREDASWGCSIVVPSGTASDGFVDGASDVTAPGVLKVAYGIDTTTLQPHDVAMQDGITKIAQLMYTIQFANSQ